MPQTPSKSNRIRRRQRRKSSVQSGMTVVISLLVLLAGLYVILAKSYDDSCQKWATGAVAFVMGFWLKR
jgi:hypothetical protein